MSNAAEGALLQTNNNEWIAAELSNSAAEMGEVCMRSKKLGPAEINSLEHSQHKEKSRENFGLSALTSCLIDVEGNSSTSAGRSRKNALGVSALIQFCTLTALLIVPLFATGSRLILRPTNFVPLPPYGGAPKQNLPRSQQQPRRTSSAITLAVHTDPVSPPIRPPTKIPTSVEMDPKIGGGSNSLLLGNGVIGAGSDGPPNLLSGFGECR